MGHQLSQKLADIWNRRMTNRIEWRTNSKKINFFPERKGMWQESWTRESFKIYNVLCVCITFLPALNLSLFFLIFLSSFYSSSLPLSRFSFLSIDLVQSTFWTSVELLFFTVNERIMKYVSCVSMNRSRNKSWFSCRYTLWWRKESASIWEDKRKEGNRKWWKEPDESSGLMHFPSFLPLRPFWIDVQFLLEAAIRVEDKRRDGRT